jgi:hypothetical protein
MPEEKRQIQIDSYLSYRRDVFLDFANSLSIGKNSILNYIKAERIAAGLHLLTSHIKDNNKIKFDIRDTSVKIMSLMVGIKDMDRYSDASLRQISFYYIFVLSLLDLALLSGLIRSENVSVMKREILSFVSQLQKDQKKSDSTSSDIDGAASIDKDFFSIPVDSIGHYKGQDKGHVDTSQNIVQSSEQNEVKKTGEALPGAAEKKELVAKNGLSRADVILKILSSREEISVNDLVMAIPGYSEKTIQRELLSLVEKGILVKKGERRWSRYFLASSRKIGPKS